MKTLTKQELSIVSGGESAVVWTPVITTIIGVTTSCAGAIICCLGILEKRDFSQVPYRVVPDTCNSPKVRIAGVALVIAGFFTTVTGVGLAVGLGTYNSTLTS